MTEKNRGKSPPVSGNDLVWLARKDPPRRLKALALSEIVTFPASVWPIDISYPELAKLIRHDGFAVIVHTFRNEGLMPKVGTLGMVQQSLKHREKDEYRITFGCLRRVQILNSVQLQIPEGSIWEVEWQPVIPINIDQKSWEEKDTGLNILLITASLEKIHIFIEKAVEQYEIQAELDQELMGRVGVIRRNLDDLEALAVALRTSTPQNFEHTLDRIMDVLERLFLALQSSLSSELLEIFRGILWKIPPGERLAMAAEEITSLYIHLEDFLHEESEESVETAPSLISSLLSQPREMPATPPPVSKEPPEGEWKKLDLKKRSRFFADGVGFFKTYLVNQEMSIEQLLRVATAIRVGLDDEDEKGPKVGGLFLGPTGTGKSEIVKVFANYLFDDPGGYLFIEGSSLMEPHSVSRLKGAEPGYIGYDEEPPITQWKLDRAHVMWMLRNEYKGRDEELRVILAGVAEIEGELSQVRQGAIRKDKVAILQRLMNLTGWRRGEHLGLALVDEIEKAHHNVQRYLLRALTDGVLQLSNGEIVICKNVIFIFTGNIYGREIADKVAGRQRPGFRVGETVEDYMKLSDELYRETLEETQKTLLPEFFGRIGKERVRVFHPFSFDDIREIVERLRLPRLAEILRKQNVQLFITEETIAFLQQEAWDPTNRALGARAVKSVIERKIKEEIALMLDLGKESVEEGITSGDSVVIDVEIKEDGSGKKIAIRKSSSRSSQ